MNALFDAIGGGDITQKLIEGLQTPANVYIYGMLSGGQPLHLTSTSAFFVGLNIGGFHMSGWLKSLTADEKKEIFANYSRYLKGDLHTKTFK